jgi:predicted nucleotidyltransferase
MQVPAEVSRLAALVAQVVRELTGPSTRVLWYGSWTRGTAVPRSDVDLAVAGDRSIPPLLMAHLRERIDELPTLRKIDLVDIHAVGDAMRDRILSEGVAV